MLTKTVERTAPSSVGTSMEDTQHLSCRFCPCCGKEMMILPDDEENLNSSGDRGIKTSTILKGVGIAIAAPCAVAAVAGFGTAGIAAGSAAAAWQSTVGNVAAGSAFAMLQSVGATGGFWSGITAGGTTFGAGKFWEWKKGVKTDSDNEEDTTNDQEINPKDGSFPCAMTMNCSHCGKYFRVTSSASVLCDSQGETKSNSPLLRAPKSDVL